MFCFVLIAMQYHLLIGQQMYADCIANHSFDKSLGSHFENVFFRVELEY